jgi:mitochondrial fission protein ELM1
LEAVLSDIWIISDGKPGHLNQSLGLVEALIVLKPQIKSHVISVSDAWGFLFAAKTKPKLIISAGSGTQLVNILLALRYRVPNVLLMKPNYPQSLFSMLLIPEHDQVPSSEHVILTKGALNRMKPVLKEIGSSLVLIGGPSKHVKWQDKRVLDAIEKLTSEAGSKPIKVATSRRTPETLLSELAANGKVELIRPESVSQDWLPKTLATTEHVWVTSDSVSMVYEALTAGCAVSLISLESNLNSRTQRGMQMLLADGIVDNSLERSAHLTNVLLAEANRCAEIILERGWL